MSIFILVSICRKTNQNKENKENKNPKIVPDLKA